ncbi:MAG: glycosyltransferase [Nitrospirae bacterium]|nr:glycosyltransferase [Nitrospirota bacterium]
MKSPKLTISLPNYNHACFLSEAIESILTQPYKEFELIIVDDGSTDNSVEIIEQFARGDSRIIFLKNKKNMGVEFSLKRILQHTTGEYIHFFSADDRIFPMFYENTMNLLARYPDAGLCCSDFATLDGITGTISEKCFNIVDAPCCFSPSEIICLLKKTHFWISGFHSIVKRTALTEAGGFKPGLKWHCDWFSLHVIAFRHGICYIPEAMAALRVLPNSYSSAGTKRFSEQREVLRNMLDYLKSLEYKDVLLMFQKSNILSIFGKNMLRLMLANPKYVDFLSPRLIWSIFALECRKIVSPYAPEGLKVVYRDIHKMIAKKYFIRKYGSTKLTKQGKFI